jgi:hypothetical protein
MDMLLHFPAFLPLQSGFSSGFYSPRAKNLRVTMGALDAKATSPSGNTPRHINGLSRFVRVAIVFSS